MRVQQKWVGQGTRRDIDPECSCVNCVSDVAQDGSSFSKVQPERAVEVACFFSVQAMRQWTANEVMSQ